MRPLGDLRQKLQGPIETGLAAAIGAGDDVEFAERQTDIAQRSIAGDGKSRHHDRRPAWVKRCNFGKNQRTFEPARRRCFAAMASCASAYHRRLFAKARPEPDLR
jgi:hypothetical protein